MDRSPYWNAIPAAASGGGGASALPLLTPEPHQNGCLGAPCSACQGHCFGDAQCIGSLVCSDRATIGGPIFSVPGQTVPR